MIRKKKKKTKGRIHRISPVQLANLMFMNPNKFIEARFDHITGKPLPKNSIVDLKSGNIYTMKK